MKLLAPNGKPSNLTPEQYSLVRTSAFKKWFGDWENSPKTASKVVDENGEPLVVWHGSQLLFNEFDLSKSLLFGEQTPEVGFHFGTLSQAKERVKSKEEKYFYQCFLNIKNMVETDDMVFFSKHKISLKLKEQGVFTNEEYQNWSKFNSVIKEKGIDGLKYLNKWEGKNYSYMVFYPNQIKLADGTNTTFDTNNNDIRYKEGGNLTDELSLILRGVTNENKYKGNYKKIFDLIEAETVFYSPYGTSHEEIKGNDFYITITPRPSNNIIEKISNLKNVKIINQKFKTGGATKTFTYTIGGL